MENMSILNLFSLNSPAGLPKKAENGQGEFENMFKNYLDRSEKPETKDTALKQIAKKEPETPEEVIKNLDIPAEDKDKLVKMLEEAETPEDISEFLNKLTEMVTESLASADMELSPQDILSELESVLTEMAKTVLASEDGGVKQSQLLEQTLDRIVAVQAQTGNNAPQLTVVKNENAVQQVQQNSAGNAGEDQSGRNGGREAAFDMAKNSTSQQIPAELREKIVELAGRQAGEAVKTETGEQEFIIRSDQSDKVIKTEIRIESPRDIMKFVELMELAKSQKANRLNIQLHPQELGRVQIELVEQGGKVSGKVFFESETARHLFNSNAEALRQQLAEKGVSVENLEFFTKDFDQHQFSGWEGKDGRKGSTGLKAESLVDDKDEKEESDGIYA